MLSVCIISFSLVDRHFNFAYMLTLQICYFVFVPCYYTILIKASNGNIIDHKKKVPNLINLSIIVGHLCSIYIVPSLKVSQSVFELKHT